MGPVRTASTKIGIGFVVSTDIAEQIDVFVGIRRQKDII